MAQTNNSISHVAARPSLPPCELSTISRVKVQPGKITPAQAYLRLLSAGVDLFAIRESMAVCQIIDEQSRDFLPINTLTH